MLQVVLQTIFFLCIASVIGAAIGYIFSSIISTSKLELLEEDNERMREDLRRYRSSYSKLETELSDSKYKLSRASSVEQEDVEAYQREIGQLKMDLEILRQASQQKTDENQVGVQEKYDALKERYHELLQERERLIDQLDRAQKTVPKEILKPSDEEIEEKVAPSSGMAVVPMAVPIKTNDIEEKSYHTGLDAAIDDVPEPVRRLVRQEDFLLSLKEKAGRIDFGKIGVAGESQKDDLQKIKGIGPFIEKKLNALGIYTFEQVSRFDEQTGDLVNEIIDFFPGRINRDNWKDQAATLQSEKGA